MLAMKLSCVIPSNGGKDIYLQKTIDSLLENSELPPDQFEIIVVLDGGWGFPLKDHPQVRILHLGKNRGMRGAINAGVSIATGEFIARSDEHCSFGKGWDRILTETCEKNWIVTPTRYFLDPEKWEIMDKEPINFCKLVIQGDGEKRKFSAAAWPERDQEFKDVMIAESMGMQGSFWMMPKILWDTVIKELQTEGYGPHIQDSHEMIFKIWQAGGKMMINKNTWHSHKHRSFQRTHNYGIAEAAPGYAYALKIWEPYFNDVIKPLWKI